MKYVLRPFGLGSESLKPFYIDSSVPQSFVLGRNIETGLDKAGVNVNHVSRNHVSVTVRDGKVMMSPIARQDNIVSFKGSACSRGEHEMAVNDEFSLLGSIQFFNYRLEVDTAREITSSGSRKRSRHSAEAEADNDDDDEVLAIDEPLVKRVSSRGSASASASASAAEVLEIDLTSPNIKRTSSRNGSSVRVKEEVVQVLSSSSNDNNDNNENNNKATEAAEGISVSVKSESATVLREFECAICYETMASVCTLVPCGDNFCFSCIADWSAKSKACPLCQGPFELSNCVSNKLLDNVIRSTLQAAGEDVAEWEKRVAEGIEQRKKLLGGVPAETNKQAPRYAAYGPPPPPMPVPVQTFHAPMYFPTAPVPPPTLAPLFGSSAMMANVRQQPAARRRRGGANSGSSVVDLT